MKQKLNYVLLIDDEPTNFMSNMALEAANCNNHIQIVQSAKKYWTIFQDLLTPARSKPAIFTLI